MKRNWYRVEPIWPGETCVCIASGPSLTVEDVEYVKGKARVIVTNSTYRLAPWADALFAADTRWWEQEKGAMAFQGQKFSVMVGSNMDRFREAYGVQSLKRTGDSGLDDTGEGIRTGRNSGHMAVHLAYQFGARTILLLGYDMKKGADGRYHWHENHRHHLASPYDMFRKHFRILAPLLEKAGVTVINCTPGSALDCFPKKPLREVLA